MIGVMIGVEYGVVVECYQDKAVVMAKLQDNYSGCCSLLW